MKKLLLALILLVLGLELSAQCAYSGFVETGTSIYTPNCNTSTINVGTNSQIRMNVTSGLWYDFNTCSSSYDTQLSGYTTGGSAQFYNDDNGPACGGTRASVYWQAGYTGELRVQNNQFNCVTTPGSGGSAVLAYRLVPPVLGSPSTTQVNFCNSGGNFGTAVTANGTAYGTVEWNWGSNNGNWNNWVSGTSSGVCCFPKKTSNSDGNADRMRYRVNNGGCVTAWSPTIYITNKWNEDPTSLSISNNSYCTTTVPATITLTANFPTSVNMNGTVGFYSGSCGGTLLGNVTAGANSSTVALTIPAPSSTTTYFVRYQPGSGTSCSNGPCVQATVNVYSPPNPGTYAYNTLYTCSTGGLTYNSAGAVVYNSVSGTSGTVDWYWGSSNGNWNYWGTGTSAPNNCCFPLNPSSTQASRMRVVVSNAGCTVNGNTVLVVSDNMTAPSSASSSSTSICSGSPSSITLSYSGGSTGVLGTARWYSNSCGGTLVGTGNNISVSAPSESTTYYVRFENPCTQTSCAEVHVTVTNLVLNASVSDLSCFDSEDGEIDLDFYQAPPSFNNSLEQWVSADKGVITNASDDVVRWIDLSGNNNDYTVTFGSGVKVQANAMNGEPAIRFNNSAIMESPNFVGNPYTVIVVGQMTGGTSRRLVSSGSLNWLMGWWGGNRDAMFAEGWVSASGGTAGSITNPYIYTATGTGSNTSLHRNGGLIASNASGVAAPGILSLGGWGTGNTEQSNGDVCEILVYDKALSTAERQEIENYLNLKYAVSVPSGVTTYLWSPGSATTEDLTGLDADTYSVTVTNNGCSESLSGIVVNERPEITISGTTANEVCPADNNGSIDATTSAGASINPSAISDLALWVKADDGVVRDFADQVVMWKDLSGNDNHFYPSLGTGIQYNATNAAFNNQPTVQTTGSNSMTISKPLSTTPYTIFVVGRKNNNDANTRRLISSSSTNWLMGWHRGDDCFYAGSWVTDNTAGPQTGNPYIYSVVNNGSSNLFYSNGTDITVNPTAGLQAPGLLCIGGYCFGGSQYTDGDVAEIIYYNKNLSTNERMAVEKYLSDKYGIGSLSGVGPTFSWSPGGATSEDISALNAGTYTLTVTDVAGCTNNESFVIGTDKTESVEAASANASVNPLCLGSSVTLSVAGGGLGTGATWQWYTGSCGGTPVASGPSITVSPTVDTDYYVRAEGDCNTTACKLISVDVISASANAYLVSGVATTATAVCVESPWTYYANPATPDEYIFAIAKNGNTFTAEITVTDVAGTNPIESLGGQPNVRGTWLISRYWNVNLTSGDVTVPVDVRFFIDENERVDALNAANAFAAANPWPSIPVSVTSLQWFKTSGVPFDPATHLINGDFTFTPTYLTSSATGTINGIRYFDLTGITSFSGGTGGFSVNDNNSPLPVELLSFEARVVNNDYVRLDWATATEVNNDGFEVLRSIDGVNFERIAWIPGNGNSVALNEYDYNDYDVVKGQSYYYQLRQVDYDGQSESFDIVFVSLEGGELFSIGNLIPNPSKGNGLVHVDVVSGSEELITTTVYNHLGVRILYSKELLQVGNNKLEFNVTDLSAGTYFINFQGSFGQETRKLILIK